MDKLSDNSTPNKDMRIIWTSEELSGGRVMLRSEQRDRRAGRQAGSQRERQTKGRDEHESYLNHNLLHNLSAAQVTAAGTIWLLHPGDSIRLQARPTRLVVSKATTEISLLHCFWS